MRYVTVLVMSALLERGIRHPVLGRDHKTVGRHHLRYGTPRGWRRQYECRLVADGPAERLIRIVFAGGEWFRAFAVHGPDDTRVGEPLLAIPL